MHANQIGIAGLRVCNEIGDFLDPSIDELVLGDDAVDESASDNVLVIYSDDESSISSIPDVPLSHNAVISNNELTENVWSKIVGELYNTFCYLYRFLKEWEQWCWLVILVLGVFLVVLLVSIIVFAIWAQIRYKDFMFDN